MFGTENSWRSVVQAFDNGTRNKVHDVLKIHYVAVLAWFQAIKNPAGGRGSSIEGEAGLPAIVSECLVGFGHTVGVFLLLDCVALALARGDDFGGQLFGHRLLVAVAGE